MKTKIQRGKTKFIDGQYYTEVKLGVNYLSADYYGKIDSSSYLGVERFILFYNDIEEFLDIKQIDKVFDDETLFLFDNYYRGRFRDVQTKYRINSKKTIELIKEGFSIIDGKTGDFITDLVLAKYAGRITLDFSEWGERAEFLFTGDDLVYLPNYRDPDRYKELINRVKMMMRHQKINNLIENVKR